MGGELIEEVDMEEVLPSMWPEDVENKGRNQFNIERAGNERDLLEDVDIKEDPSVVDFKRLVELTNYSEKGSSQLNYLVKHWEYRQANASRLLNEELANLSKQRQEVELKKLEILQGQWVGDDGHAGAKRTISILNDVRDIWGKGPRKKNDSHDYHTKLEINAEYDTVTYWKQRALQLDKLLEDSIQREQALVQKLQENIKNLETQSKPVEELSEILQRADNFLHFILQTAPIVMGHQDKELRYRFIYNHFPSLAEQDIIGKTDTEIFTGAGVDEIEDFKREVFERGTPAKREITFITPLFGAKTFLIYVEPVYSKQGEKIGLNYMGMDVTDQVLKREKMMKLREELAVQKAKETELNKTIHITDETMRAKQMLATMSHEIRSPLAGVVSMAEILATTRLDKEQRQLLDVMLSSGDLVLQLINDILDLSKVESGAMKLEATKFRPREVVRHVLQTAAASLKKELTLKGHVAVDVPIEVVGDVLRIRQILTNLISNAIKFTHDGEVAINLCVVARNCSGNQENNQLCNGDSVHQVNGPSADGSSVIRNLDDTKTSCYPASCDCGQENGASNAFFADECSKKSHAHQEVVWLRCDVRDTGIGIPEKALPTLFKKYMQASADHARKYGGTGLGLAICKQLVELMGGSLTVTSKERQGSTFTFVLPCKVPRKVEKSDDSDDDAKISDAEDAADASTDEITGSFLFKPLKPGALKLSNESMDCENGKTTLASAGTISIAPAVGTAGFDSFEFNDCPPKKIRTSDAVSQTSVAENISKEAEDTLMKIGDPDGHQDAKSSFVMHKFSNSGADPSRNQSIAHQGQKEMMHTNGSSPDAHNNKPQCQNEGHDKDAQSTSSSWVPRILLVEDNKVNIMVAQSMMKRLGHKIEVVNNGLEAIRAVQKSHYDLILMDVCMPVMDGLQATRLIRSFEEHGYWDPSVYIDEHHAMSSSDLLSHSTCCRKRISIIAMTANALAESATDCLANGMDSFVSKPVTFQSLNQCLQQYLSR